MSTRLAFSPCPNDTFALCALAEKRIPLQGNWQLELYDIETLNQKALNQESGIFKVSLGTYPKLKNYRLMPCGFAVTDSAGPVLVAKQGADFSCINEWKIALPGQGTTAAWLAKRLAPRAKEYVNMRYDLVLAAIANSEVDAGVLIHEARFTYPQWGLKLVLDLGKQWQEIMHIPLVLAGVVASSDIPAVVCEAFCTDYRASLVWSKNNPSLASPYITRHAQEKDPLVIRAHIDHFVGPYTHSATDQLLTSLQHFFDENPADLCHSS